MNWGALAGIVLLGVAICAFCRFGVWIDRAIEKHLGGLEKYPYPNRRDRREAEMATREMHARARMILEDHPRRMTRRGNAFILSNRPLNPVPGDEVTFLRPPPPLHLKPDLVETQRRPGDDTDELNRLISLDGFGGIVDPKAE